MPFDGSQLDQDTQILIYAREFLTKGWCRKDQAKNKDGESVDPSSRHAVSWCAYGALVAAGMRNGAREGERGYGALMRLLASIGDGYGGPAPFNNRQETVDPVLEAFDKAISV